MDDERTETIGEVLAIDAESVLVRLDGGNEVRAAIPRSRKFCLIPGSILGWKVVLSLRKPPKLARVVKFIPPV